jgi:hypothetical protein
VYIVHSAATRASVTSTPSFSIGVLAHTIIPEGSTEAQDTQDQTVPTSQAK